MDAMGEAPSRAERRRLRDVGAGGVSPTLSAFDNATETRATVCVTGPTGVRRLTPLECERLMGLPDDWTRWRVDERTGDTVEQADSSRYRQCGNGLVVPVMEWVLGRLAEQP